MLLHWVMQNLGGFPGVLQHVQSTFLCCRQPSQSILRNEFSNFVSCFLKLCQAGDTSAGAPSFILCRTVVYVEEYQTSCKGMEQESDGVV